MAPVRTCRRLLSSAAGFLAPFLSFVYPPACLCCNAALERSAGLVCAACWASLGRVGSADPAYRKALACLLEGDVCAGLAAPYYFEAGGPMQRLIHELKYNGTTALGTALGARVAATMPDEACAAGPALIVPVPLHRVKLRERGYNQAAWIAGGLGEFLGVPVVCGLVRRRRYTQTQTHLDVDRRRANVAGAFQVVRARLPAAGGTVVLVDDVITTGATMRACAGALREAGVEKVYACAAALAK